MYLSELFALPGAAPKTFHGESTTGGVTELLGRKKDGSEIHAEYSVVDVSLGAMSRRLAIVIDVTERHEVEKLRKAFVAMVSHDLRTPLTSVAGFLQLLPMGVYGELAAKAVGEVNLAEGQVEQLIMLINDLLDLEKLEAGKLEMSRAQVVLRYHRLGARHRLFSCRNSPGRTDVRRVRSRRCGRWRALEAGVFENPHLHAAHLF